MNVFFGRSPRWFVVCVVLACALAGSAFAADAKLEKGIALPDGVPEAMKALLSPTGYRVIDEAGAPYAEIWLAKSVPGEPQAASGDVGYPGLSDGTFLGLWRYAGNGSDYRGQAVKPGLYSMRYALMPADGNHMGAFPFRDFVLLLPATADQSPGSVVKWDDAVNISKKAANTNHPAIYPMTPAESAGDAALSKDDQGHYLLKALTAGKGGAKLAIQVVVIGHGEA